MHDNDYLAHYGVKGQKWGIRRYQNKNGTLTSAGKKHRSNKTKGWSKEAKRANAIKKKSVHQMTNKELSELNKRQELENKYRQNNPSTIKKGMKVAGTMVATMGTVSALYNNSQNMIRLGQKAAKSMSKAYNYADMVIGTKKRGDYFG